MAVGSTSTAARFLVSAGLLLPGGLAGAEVEAGREVSVELVSRYIWRGYDLSHGDPALRGTWRWAPRRLGGLWVSVEVLAGWRQDAALGDGASEIDEVDLTIGWETSDLARGRLTLGVACSHSRYTSTWTRDVAYQDDSDGELGLSLAWRAATHFRPTLEIAWGFRPRRPRLAAAALGLATRAQRRRRPG